MQRNEWMACALALTACLLWSGNFIIARGVAEIVSPFTLAFWRWAVAAAVILPFGWRHLRRQWPLIRQHWRYMVVMGLSSVSIYNTLIYCAAHYTSSHHLALISSTAPIWTLFFAGVLGTERLSRYKIGGAVCAFIGALVIVSHGHPELLLSLEWNRGDMMVVAAAFIWAVYCVLLHFKPQGIHMLAFLSVLFLVGLAGLTPLYLYDLAQGRVTPFTPAAWAAYLYVGIASSVLAWFAWNSAVHVIGAVKTGLFYYMIPVFSGALAIVLLDEPVRLYHALGFACIFTGILISNLRKLGWTRRTQPQHP